MIMLTFLGCWLLVSVLLAPVVGKFMGGLSVEDEETDDPRWQHPAFQPWHGREPC